MVQIFGNRQKETMFSAPSVKPCVLHVFVFLNSHIPNCQYVTYGLRLRFVFCECSSLPRLLCRLLQDIDLYFYLLHMLLALITAQLQLCTHEITLLELCLTATLA